MIPIVEDYLSDLIQGKLTDLKNDPNQIDLILRTSQDRLDRLKTLIQSKPINVIRGYPITPAVMPCICILLSGEEETQDGLGDYGDDTQQVYTQKTEQVSVIDTMNADYPFPYVRLTNVPVDSISKITDANGNIIDPTDYLLEYPDQGVIGIAAGIVEHGETLNVTYTAIEAVTEQMEVLYEANYRLEVWSTNGDLTVELYHILKWTLLAGRGDLIQNYDIFRQRLSGADFEPVTNMSPDFVYRRALSFWCQFIVSTPDAQSGFVNNVVLNQTNYTDRFGVGGGEF